MIAQVNTATLTTGGILVTTVDDAGATLALTGDTVAPDFTISLTAAQSRSYASFLDSAEDARDLEILADLQGHFETEMGAELLAFNSQALVKNAATREYLQAVTRIAFDAYKKGLDGVPN